MTNFFFTFGFQPGYKYDLFSLVLSVSSPFYRAASTPIPRIESVFFDDFSSGMKLSFPWQDHLSPYGLFLFCGSKLTYSVVLA